MTVAFLLILVLSYGAQPQKVRACSYLILFRVFRAISLLWVVLSDASLDSGMSEINFSIDTWVLIWLSLGFFIKLPLYFLHSWLPRVHVEAPTSVRVVLAALLLKMGSWGLYYLFVCYSWEVSYSFFW